MNRRSLLKQIGVVGSTVIATNPVSARRNSSGTDPFDPEFDPKSKKETAKFVFQVFNVAERKVEVRTDALKRSLESRLDSAQKQAVGQYLQDNTRLKRRKGVRSSNDADEAITANSYGTYEYTVSTEIELYLCSPTIGCGWYSFDAYDYTHELGWEYDGSAVASGSASTTGNGNNYALVKWSYDGDEDEEMVYHSDDLYVKSYRQGHFVQSVFVDGFFDENQYPEIELLGDSNGYGNVTETSPK